MEFHTSEPLINIAEVFLALVQEGRKHISDDLSIGDEERVEHARVTNTVLRAALLITAKEDGIPVCNIEACLGTPRQALTISEITSLLLVPSGGDGEPPDGGQYLYRLATLVQNAATLTHADRLMRNDENFRSAVTSTTELLLGLPTLLPEESIQTISFEIVLLTSSGEDFLEGEVPKLIRLLCLDHIDCT
ncbi:hypothetical protein KBC59_03730 [Patescibacteria group bacterium]|nr:hypothetical protein [Patescibacteria group bacterium]